MCKVQQNCTWFTFDELTGLCNMFSNCATFDSEHCQVIKIIPYINILLLFNENTKRAKNYIYDKIVLFALFGVLLV